MNAAQDSGVPISAQAKALSQYIQNTVAHLKNRSHAECDQSNLIYLGNWQDPYPRLLVTDPVLEPVDKLVWQIIRLHISAPAAVTAFPNYETLRTLANIRSNHTVARALAILRATRWLSLCARVRDAMGRYLGNIYVLHDEPVTLGDAVYLDGEYMAFLQTNLSHKHMRVKSIVESVIDTLTDQIDNSADITQHCPQTQAYERRIGAMTHMDSRNDFYAISDSRIQTLSQQPAYQHAPPVNNVQVQNMHTDICSSSNYINTTTTKTYTACAHEALHFPPDSSANERTLAMMYLNTIDADEQQNVLDEWQGRLGVAKRGNTPIENPIGYLAGLCRRAKSGEFNITIGLKVREARERQKQHNERDQQQRSAEADRQAQVLDALQQVSTTPALSRIQKRLEQIRNRKQTGKAEHESNP